LRSCLLVSLSPPLLVFFAATAANADLIVFANRTPGQVRAEVQPITGLKTNLTLGPDDVVPVYLDGRANVTFNTGRETKRYLLDSNCAYYFGRVKDGLLDLQKIGLGEDASSIEGRALPGSPTAAPIVIPVKLLVDEDEPARRPMWERRLRDRIAAASAVLDKYCNVQLKVVAVDTWNSDDATSDFFESLGELEREVNPFPGRLVIAFTSQYQAARGRTHMAGTRGILHSHILVREWSRTMTEPERLELLVHELGHHLGAAHSPEPTSVMRPVLGNSQSVGTNFRIRFDPVNTLTMGLIAEELRRRKIQSVRSLSPGTRQRLNQIYKALSPTLPDDAAAAHLNRMVGTAPATSPNAATKRNPLVESTKQVVKTIEEAARANFSLPIGTPSPGTRWRRGGDELLEYYVQRSAGVSQMLAPDVGVPAFLMGLGIALDNGNALRNHATYGVFVQTVESPRDRSLRGVFLGEPTIHERRDLAQQFVLAAYLTAVGGPQIAESVVLNHELAAAKKGKGFSFVDVAVGRAGIHFAGEVLAGRCRLGEISSSFAIADFVPPTDGLAEGLTADALAAQFGDPADERFRAAIAGIDERIRQLPGYRANGIALER
jgi:hypothetical protein